MNWTISKEVFAWHPTKHSACNRLGTLVWYQTVQDQATQTSLWHHKQSERNVQIHIHLIFLNHMILSQCELCTLKIQLTLLVRSALATWVICSLWVLMVTDWKGYTPVCPLPMLTWRYTQVGKHSECLNVYTHTTTCTVSVYSITYVRKSLQANLLKAVHLRINLLSLVLAGVATVLSIILITVHQSSFGWQISWYEQQSRPTCNLSKTLCNHSNTCSQHHH